MLLILPTDACRLSDGDDVTQLLVERTSFLKMGSETVLGRKDSSRLLLPAVGVRKGYEQPLGDNNRPTPHGSRGRLSTRCPEVVEPGLPIRGKESWIKEQFGCGCGCHMLCG